MHLSRRLAPEFMFGSCPCTKTAGGWALLDWSAVMRSELLTRIVVANAVAFLFAMIAASIGAAKSATLLPL
jgi:hypothetical protein